MMPTCFVVVLEMSWCNQLLVKKITAYYKFMNLAIIYLSMLNAC